MLFNTDESTSMIIVLAKFMCLRLLNDLIAQLIKNNVAGNISKLKSQKLLIK